MKILEMIGLAFSVILINAIIFVFGRVIGASYMLGIIIANACDIFAVVYLMYKLIDD